MLAALAWCRQQNTAHHREDMHVKKELRHRFWDDQIEAGEQELRRIRKLLRSRRARRARKARARKTREQ